jgi:hypothetical protein
MEKEENKEKQEGSQDEVKVDQGVESGKNKKSFSSWIMAIVVVIVLFFGFKFVFKVHHERQQDVLKFGFLTDVHSYSKSVKNKKKEILGYEVNWRALNPMTDFVERMNKKFHPDFVIENGDYIKSSKERAREEFLELEEF